MSKQEKELNTKIDEQQDKQENSQGSENNEVSSIESLSVTIADLEAQLQDEKLRTAATIQNLNRRHQDELQAAHKFAASQFIQEILPVKDYLEMALADQSGNFEALKMGVDLTLKQLMSVFDKSHIEEINPIGELLDPNKHSAMGTEESEEAPNTVLKIMQKGYALNNRVLRPAAVIVAVAKTEKETE